MQQYTIFLILLAVLFLLLVVGLIYQSRKKRLSRTRLKGCEIMHNISPGAECVNTICADTPYCMGVSRALKVNPDPSDCVKACEDMSYRIANPDLYPDMKDGNICDYSFCGKLEPNIVACQVCSIDYAFLCDTPSDYALAIEAECRDATEPGDRIRCDLACVDLTDDGANDDNACLHKPTYCSAKYSVHCRCDYNYYKHCTDDEIEGLVMDCWASLVDYTEPWPCVTPYNYYETTENADYGLNANLSVTIDGVHVTGDVRVGRVMDKAIVVVEEACPAGNVVIAMVAQPVAVPTFPLELGTFTVTDIYGKSLQCVRPHASGSTFYVPPEGSYMASVNSAEERYMYIPYGGIWRGIIQPGGATPEQGEGVEVVFAGGLPASVGDSVTITLTSFIGKSMPKTQKSKLFGKSGAP